MRLLYDSRRRLDPGPVRAADLRRLYAFPARPSTRAVMISTLDGSVTGADRRSGSIGTPADRTIYLLQRELADAVLVGAGTARAESYHPPQTRADGSRLTLVVVSERGSLPPSLATASTHPGSVLFITPRSAAPRRLATARRCLGAEHVWTIGEDHVDLAELRARLTGHGLRHLVCEGGPTLLGAMYAADLIDEVALTTAPLTVGGDASRIINGPAAARQHRLAVLLEGSNTLLGLWRVQR